MDARRRELLEAISVAQRHIVGDGNFFSASQRKELAEESVAAWINSCNACHEARSAGGELFDVSSYQPAHGRSFLHLFAHSTANLQQRVTRAWHGRMCMLMHSSMPELGELDPLDTYAAFAELLLVSSWAVGIASFFVALGEPMPAFPTCSVGEGVSRRKRVKDFVSSVKHNPATGFSPFIERLLPGLEHDQRFLDMVRGGEMVPFAQVMLCPLDVSAWARWWEVMYIPGNDVTTLFKEAPQSRFLTRSQLEAVAAGLTGALECAY